MTVRLVTPAGETAREYPSAPPHLLLDDSLFAPHAVALPLAPGTVRAITLRGGTRGTADLADHGLERTAVGTTQRSLHHFSVTVDGERRDLWYDDRGRLWKVAIPSRSVIALRSP